MKMFFRAKPSWDNGYKLNEETGQWTPPPEWATHIIQATATSGVYTWAEKSATGHFLGEPRYRDGVQSRDIFTIGPDAWKVVEARPAPAVELGALIGWTWEHMRTRHFTACERDALAIAEHPLPVVSTVHIGRPINKSSEPDSV
jgi:hypothetical protein